MKKRVLGAFALIIVMASCSKDNPVYEENNIDQTQFTLKKVSYVYEGEEFAVSFKDLGNDHYEIEDDQNSRFLESLAQTQPELTQVVGIDGSSRIYLFDNAHEFEQFSIENYGTTRSNDIELNPGPNTLRLYFDSYLNKELDYYSSCYRQTDPFGISNHFRLKNMDNGKNPYWTWADPNVNCYASPYNSANDKLSSLEMAPGVNKVVIYEHRDYGGKRLVLFNNGVYPYSGPSGNGWFGIGRLKSFSFGFGRDWDDKTSSIQVFAAGI